MQDSGIDGVTIEDSYCIGEQLVLVTVENEQGQSTTNSDIKWSLMMQS